LYPLTEKSIRSRQALMVSLTAEKEESEATSGWKTIWKVVPWVVPSMV